MWDWFINFLMQILQWLADFSGDWGVAVIILTIIIRLLVMPLMTKSTASSARMQALQPKMKEIQDKYADDPERQAEELRKFTAENKFNPLGGCLPIFLQMPVFFALFTVAKQVPASAHFLNIMPSLGMSAAQAMEKGISVAAVYIIFDVLFGILTFIPMIMNLQNTPDEQRQQTLVSSGLVGPFLVPSFSITMPLPFGRSHSRRSSPRGLWTRSRPRPRPSLQIRVSRLMLCARSASRVRTRRTSISRFSCAAL